MIIDTVSIQDIIRENTIKDLLGDNQAEDIHYNRLLEDGGNRLLEDGSFRLLESATP